MSREKSRLDVLMQNVETDSSFKSQTDPQSLAKSLVYGYIKSEESVSHNDIKLVWFCRTLQNWKAMVADLRPGGMFFEVTHNGDKKETYLDAYVQKDNVVFREE